MFTTLVKAQEPSASLYDNMTRILTSDRRETDFYPFLESLSKREFKQLVVEYRQRNEPSPQVDIYGGMNMLATPYYARGAGKNDGVSEWSQDIRDHSLPEEWRQIILGHPPFKPHDLTPGDIGLYSNALRAIAFSMAEPPGLRRGALLGLQHTMSVRDYADMLKRSVTSGDEAPSFRREALLQMSRIVYRGRLKPQQSPEFNSVANDYESLLSDMESRTNLPPVLDEGVKLLKRQKKPARDKGSAASH